MNLIRFKGVYPIDGWAYGPVTWIAGVLDGDLHYSKTSGGDWFSVTPRHSHTADVPVRITDEALIKELERVIGE